MSLRVLSVCEHVNTYIHVKLKISMMNRKADQEVCHRSPNHSLTGAKAQKPPAVASEIKFPFSMSKHFSLYIVVFSIFLLLFKMQRFYYIRSYRSEWKNKDKIKITYNKAFFFSKKDT